MAEIDRENFLNVNFKKTKKQFTVDCPSAYYI